MEARFLSNVDGHAFLAAIQGLDPARTLFLVASKTFTTLETQTNAHAARDWIARALGDGATEEECRRGLEFFFKYYSIHKLDNTVLYPGVRGALEALSGMPMAVLTNKPVGASRGILQGLGLAETFRFIYGGNSFERKKPDPMGVETILRELGAEPAQAMIVGDSEIDVQTARNAGTWICGVTYGFGSHRFDEFPPDLIIDSLAELVPHLSGAPVRDSR